MPVWKFWLLVILAALILLPAAFVVGVGLRPKIDHRPAPPVKVSVVVNTPQSGDTVTIVTFRGDGSSFVSASAQMLEPNIIEIEANGQEIRDLIAKNGWVGVVWKGQPYQCYAPQTIEQKVVLNDYLPMQLMKMRWREDPSQALKRAWDEDHPK